MARPADKYMGGRYRVILTFDMPTVAPTRADLRHYIKEALETHRSRLFSIDEHALDEGLSQVTIEAIERVR